VITTVQRCRFCGTHRGYADKGPDCANPDCDTPRARGTMCWTDGTPTDAEVERAAYRAFRVDNAGNGYSEEASFQAVWRASHEDTRDHYRRIARAVLTRGER
jgi:hypothetical protein